MQKISSKIKNLHSNLNSRIKAPLQIVGKIKQSNNTWRADSRNIVLKHEVSNFTKEFKRNFITLMISSFGLVVALTWNNFWSSWVNSLNVENTLVYKFYIAIAVTIAAVIFTYAMSKFKD